MFSNGRFLGDSTSTFADSFTNEEDQDTSSRWDCDEKPMFPLSLSSRVSPKLPKRQRTNESVKADMIELMIAEEDTHIMHDNSGNDNNKITSLGTFSDQSSESTLSPIRFPDRRRSASTQDCPVQSVTNRRIPRRQFGSKVSGGLVSGCTSSLLFMRIQSLSRVRGTPQERKAEHDICGRQVPDRQPGSSHF